MMHEPPPMCVRALGLVRSGEAGTTRVLRQSRAHWGARSQGSAAMVACSSCGQLHGGPTIERLLQGMGADLLHASTRSSKCVLSSARVNCKEGRG